MTCEKCGLGKRIVWLAAPGMADQFIIVLIPGRPRRDQADNDFSHPGFALGSRAEVDAMAKRARAAGILAWETRDEPFPVGSLRCARPRRHNVEFSYGQPLGPGARG